MKVKDIEKFSIFKQALSCRIDVICGNKTIKLCSYNHPKAKNDNVMNSEVIDVNFEFVTPNDYVLIVKIKDSIELNTLDFYKEN